MPEYMDIYGYRIELPDGSIWSILASENGQIVDTTIFSKEWIEAHSEADA